MNVSRKIVKTLILFNNMKLIKNKLMQMIKKVKTKLNNEVCIQKSMLVSLLYVFCSASFSNYSLMLERI